MASTRPKVHLSLPAQGVRADLDDFHIPPDALRRTTFNWLFRDGEVVTRPGLTAIAQVTRPNPIGIISYSHPTTGRIVVHAAQGEWWFYSVSNDLWQAISDPSLLWSIVSSQVAFRVFNSGGTLYLLGVNGISTPRAWDSDPTHTFELFGGNAPSARAIAIIADRVVLALASDSQAVDVSAFQDHTSGWGVTQTAVLVDTPGAIISMNELGANQAAIYKTDAVYLASGTTGLAPIRFDLHSASVPGPAGLGAVVPLSSRLHAIFTASAELFLFDGVSYTAHPSSDRVRTLVNENITQQLSSRAQIHGFYNLLNNELWWFYPRAGLEANGPRDAVVINMSNGSVWKEDFNNAAFSFRTSYFGNWLETAGTRSVSFVGRDNGQFYLLEGETDAGSAIAAQMDTGMSPLGDPTLTKTLLETEHYFGSPSSTQALSVSPLVSEASETISLLPAQNVTLTPTSDGPYTIGHQNALNERPSSRFFGLRIAGTALTSRIKYRGSSISFAPRGLR